MLLQLAGLTDAGTAAQAAVLTETCRKGAMLLLLHEQWRHDDCPVCLPPSQSARLVALALHVPASAAPLLMLSVRQDAGTQAQASCELGGACQQHWQQLKGQQHWCWQLQDPAAQAQVGVRQAT
jgi:hypothetical protein